MSKLQQLQTYLKENQIDAAFITTPDNVFYFSNFKSNPHERLLGVMVFQEAEPFLVCPKMEVPDAVNAGWSQEIIGHLDTDNPWNLIADAIQSRGIKVVTLAIEKSHLTVERLESLQKFMCKQTLYDLMTKSMKCVLLRMKLRLRKCEKLQDLLIMLSR